MRKLQLSLLVGAMALFLGASQANALATVTTLINGVSAAGAVPANTIVTIDVVLQADATAIGAYSLSLDFSVFDGLTAVVDQTPGSGVFNLPLPPPALSPGGIQSMGAGSLFTPGILPGNSLLVATIQINYLGGVDNDVRWQALVAGVDGLATTAGADLAFDTVGASIPEPTTAALFALGLGGVAWSGRRRQA